MEQKNYDQNQSIIFLFYFKIYVIDSADRKRFDETGEVKQDFKIDFNF